MQPETLTPVIRVVLLLCLALGVVVRLMGYFSSDLQLWLDEAGWAVMMLKGTAAWIRPAGYMALSHALVSLRNDEVMLRLPSFVAGLASLPLLWWLLRQLTVSSWAVCFGLFLFAINPIAVGMTKEFKPYMIEAVLHVLLVGAAWRYVSTNRRSFILWLSMVALVSPLFAWSVVFAYPAVFGVCVAVAFARKQHRDMWFAVAGAIATFVVLAIIWKLRVASGDENTKFWGKKYDVFYVAHSDHHVLSPVLWMLRKTVDVVAAPLHVDTASFLHNPAVLTLMTLIALLLVAAALLHLAKARAFAQLALLLVPCAVAVVFNMAGKWPWGMFRTNVFTLVYSVSLLTIGAGVLLQQRQRPRTIRAAVLLLVTTTVLVFPWRLSSFSVKEEQSLTLSSSVRSAMEHIFQHTPAPLPGAEKPVLLMDGHACGIFEYYERYHVDTAPVFGSFFRDRFDVQCTTVGLQRWPGHLHQHAAKMQWLLSAKPSVVALSKSRLPHEDCVVELSLEMPVGTHLVRCQWPRPSRATGAP